MSNFINFNFWKKKKVFITGHTGFKGSWLCLILNLLGAEVIGYALKPKTRNNLYEMAGIKKVIKKSIIADIRNYKKLEKEIQKSKAEIIFHLAAQPLVRYSYDNPIETFETNILGTTNILEIIRKNRFIKTSILITSDKVYDTTLNKIYKETDFLRGVDPYSSSKVCCEHIVYSYIKSFFKNSKQQKVATVRAGNVIGGGDYSKDRLIPDIFFSVKKKKKVTIRNPHHTRPWQYVLEPLSGYIRLAQELFLNKKKVLQEEQNWNFGPDVSNCRSVKYIVKYLSKQIPLKSKNLKKIINKSNHETNFLRLNNKKTKKFLQWFPKWNLNISLDKIIEWHYLIKNHKVNLVCEKQIREYLQF